jgi:PAS domain S-box-containing protein
MADGERDPKSSIQNRKSSILIVEDEAIIAAHLERILGRLGYDVAGMVASGEEALQKVEETTPDLVLMDIKLVGGLDGIEAAAQIRDRFGVPVVYLTGYAEDMVIQQAKTTEPYGYLAKPVHERELRATIEMALYRHKLETRLRENERWLDTTLRSIGDAVMATDRRGRVTFMNPVAENLTGWQQEEALGRDLSEVFHIVDETTGDVAENPVLKVTREGVVVGLANHTLLINKDGTNIPIDDSGAPIRDDDGNITGVVLVFRDITERVRGEEALRESEEQLQTVLDSVQTGIVVIDAETHVIADANPIAIEMFGIPREQIIGSVCHDYICPEEKGRCPIIDLGQTADSSERVLLSADGSRVSILKTVVPVVLKGRQHLLESFMDITERVRAEDALRESEERFREIIEHSQDALYKRNLETGRYEYMSPAIVQITGYTPDEVMAMSPDEVDSLIHPEDLERLNDVRRNVLETPQEDEMISPAEYRVKGKDGSYRWISDHFALLRGPEGRPSFSVATVRDITERKRAEEALRRRADELAALQATILDITAPHDLPTLLHTIVERAASVLNALGGGLYLCDPDQEQARCVVSYNTPRDFSGTVLKYGEGAAGTVAQTGESLIIDDYRTWSRRSTRFDEEQPFTAMVSAPMIWQGQVRGVIHVLDDVADRRFTQADLNLLTLFANHAALAVENTRLYEQAQQEITERKRAEEELRSLSAIVEQSVDSIVCTDTEFRITYVNNAAEELFGWSLDELKGKTPDLFNAEPLADEIQEQIYTTVSSRETYFGEALNVRKNGRMFYCQFKVSPLLDENGDIYGYMGSQRDVTERKQAEEALRESEERFRSLVETTSDWIWEVDQNGVYTYASPKVRDLLGYEPEQVIGKTPFDLMPPDEAERVAGLFQDIVESQEPFAGLENANLNRNGRLVVIETSGVPILDAIGNLLGYRGIDRDITERKRAEEVLQESEERLKLALEAASDGLYDWNMQTGEVYFSPRYYTMLGYEPGEMPASYDTWANLLHPDDREYALNTVNEYAEEKRDSHEIEFRMHAKSGGWRWILSRGHVTERDASGRPVRMVGTHVDITERKWAEEALRESEERYRLLLESIPDSVYVLDREWRHVVVNDAAERFVQISKENLLGGKLTDLFPGVEGTEFFKVFQRVMETRKSDIVVNEYAFEDGRKGWYEVRVYPVREGILCISRDITERKQAEEALQWRNQELTLLNRAGRTFNSTLDLEQVLIQVLGTVRDLLEVLDSSIWLQDKDTDELVCRYLSNPQSEGIRGWRLSPGQGIAGWTAENGQSVLVPDTREDPRHFEGVDQHIGREIRSLMAVPLWDQQTVFGVLEVVDKKPRRFAAADRQVIESLAATASIAIQNARLYAQTQQDAETKATLLREVNHRVGNNLAAIIGLLDLERKRAKVNSQAAYEAVMEDLVSRIQGLATAHHLLSAAEWSPLLLSELTEEVIDTGLQTLPLDEYVSVEVSSSPVRVTPRQANNLALVVNELTTNSVKHAWATRQTRHIAVRIDGQDDVITFEFRDNGVGYPEEVLRLERHGVGWSLIQSLVGHSLRGEVSLHNDGGAVTTLRFPAMGSSGSMPRRDRREGLN